MGKTEIFLTGVYMMKLQGILTLAISAYLAFSTEAANQFRLLSLPRSSNVFHSAFLAAITSTLLKIVICRPVFVAYDIGHNIL